MNNAILLVEISEQDAPGQLVRVLSDAGYSYNRAVGAGMAFAELDRNDYALILVDLTGVKLHGDRLLRALHLVSPQTPIVAFTSETNTRYILDLLRAGAWDCQILPIDLDRLDTVLYQALSSDRPTYERANLWQVLFYDGSMSRKTNPMHSFCLSLLGGEESLSSIRSPVVIVKGECGTGKSVVAQTLHRQSAQANARMVRIDLCECAPAEGASGALTECLGQALTQARDGTLLLEHINLLSSSQAEAVCALLGPYRDPDFDISGHALPRRVIMTYGASVRRESLSEEGIERLCQSLHPEIVQLPSLRAHPEVIPDLVGQYLAYCRSHMQIPVWGVDSLAMRSLLFHSWPGNLREFASVLEGATVLCNGHHLQLEHLPVTLHRLDAANHPRLLKGGKPSLPAR